MEPNRDSHSEAGASEINTSGVASGGSGNSAGTAAVSVAPVTTSESTSVTTNASADTSGAAGPNTSTAATAATGDSQAGQTQAGQTQQSQHQTATRTPEADQAQQTGSIRSSLKVPTYPSWGDMLALLGAFIIATVISGLLNALLIKSGVAMGVSTFICYLVQFGGTIGFALIQKFRRAPKGTKLLNFSFRSVDPAITLWGLIMVVAAGIVIEPVLALFPDTMLEGLKKLMGSGGWIIITSVLMAPILEEILFRGVIQDSLTAKLGAVRGIIVAAAIFGIVHIVPQQVVNAFFIGLILGYIYYRTKSLIPVIIIHGINNAIAQFMYMVTGGEISSTREIIASDQIYNIIYICSCIILITAIVFGSIAMKREKIKQLHNQ